MKYLLDTNIIIEGLLGGKKGEDVKNLFKKVDIFLMAITDLSLHSIGIILFRFKKKDLFFSFIKDTIYNGMAVVSLEIENFKKLYFFSEKFNIDFEDAYQYAIADKYNLTIISFDKDFDRTERKRIQPVDILK